MPDGPHPVRFGVFEADLAAGELRRNGARVKLQEQPFQVLAALLEKPGEIVSKEELRERIWTDDTFVDFDRSLATAVNKVRQALGDSATRPRFVETVPKKGYRFVAGTENDILGRESPANAGTPVPASNRRHLRPILVLAAMIAVLVVAFVAVPRYSRPGTDYSSSTPLRPLPVTTDPGRELCPSLSPDGSQVAFAADSESREGLDIYVKSIGHGTRLRLTTHPSDEWSPAWSPDGQTIAFARLGGEAGFEIHLVPALGGAEQKIYELDPNPVTNEVAGPLLAWAPNGKWLAVPCRTETPGGSGLCLLSPQTRELQSLTAPGTGFMNGDTGPAFSPDGARLAFVRQHSLQGGNLCILDLDDDLRPSGEPIALTSGNRFVASPAWTPEGSEIVFFAAEEAESSFALWRIRALGGSKARHLYSLAARSTLSISRGGSAHQARMVYTHQVSDANIWRVRLPGPGEDAAPVAAKFLASTRDDAQPQFSPDGHTIVFRSGRSGFSEVWLCDSDGSNVRPLTNLGALIAGFPRWSPDGRRIVFHARLRDQADLYVVDADGGLPRRLTTDPADEVTPNWSRDGRWVYFARPSQTGLQLWKLPAEGGEAVQLTSRGGRICFESSDGRRVYYSKSRQHAGLFHMPVADRLFEGPESRLLDSALPAAFFVAENRIYFIDGKGGWNNEYEGESLKYLDLASGQVFKLAPIDGAVATGLTVSADGRTLLYTRVDSVDSDLMMLDEFR